MERLFCFYKCVSIIVCVDYIQERMSYFNSPFISLPG